MSSLRLLLFLENRFSLSAEDLDCGGITVFCGYAGGFGRSSPVTPCRREAGRIATGRRAWFSPVEDTTFHLFSSSHLVV